MTDERRTRDETRIDELLRDAYRDLVLESPDLEERVVRAVREETVRTGARQPAHEEATTASLPPRWRRRPGKPTRWAMRAYWAATAWVSVVLVVRAGTAALGPVTLALGAVAGAILMLGASAVARATGRSTSRLIAGSV